MSVSLGRLPANVLIPVLSVVKPEIQTLIFNSSCLKQHSLELQCICTLFSAFVY